jgi:hypothetical protein
MTGSGSRLLQGGGLGLLFLEEAGGLDAASSTSLMMASSRARRAAASVSSGMATARGENQRRWMNNAVARVSKSGKGKKLRLLYHVSEEG